MARLSKAEREERDAKVMAMLAKGTPVDLIEAETGASRATIFRRKAAMRDAEEAAQAEERDPRKRPGLTTARRLTVWSGALPGCTPPVSRLNG